MRSLRIVAAGAFALVLLGGSAEAARVSGDCTGSATSFDADGAQLDEVSAPGRGGTSKDPFVVDPDGTVAYEGSTGVALHDHSWSVDVMGIAVKSGGSANEGDLVSTDGTVDVEDYLPVAAVGLFKVSASISASEGICSGSLWVKVDGSPVGTVPWLVGVAATAGGGALLAGPAVAGLRGLRRIR